MSSEHIIAFVLLGVRPVTRTIPIYRSLKRTRGIVEMHEITGQYDLMIKLAANNLEHLREILDEIRDKRGVESLEVSVSYNKVV